MKAFRVIAPIVLMGAACGTEPTDIDVSLEAPTHAEARVSISAALEVSDLLDSGLADRIVIEDITVNLAEVRLLAADPRIPPGGYSLLSKAALLEFYGPEDSKLELPFPEQFLSQDDLAVYIRIAPSAALESASIIISGRFYQSPIAGGQSELKATGSRTGASDPDGDPVMPDDERTARDNDADQRASGAATDGPGDCASDPDGDPVDCGQHALVGNGSSEESVAFELRTSDIADLVATLGTDSALNVVVGIPASRWFTDEVIESLDRAVEAENSPIQRTNDKVTDDDVIVVDSAERAATDKMQDPRDDYFVTDREIDDLTVRR